MWQLAPICNDDEGAYALSATQNLQGVSLIFLLARFDCVHFTRITRPIDFGFQAHELLIAQMWKSIPAFQQEKSARFLLLSSAELFAREHPGVALAVKEEQMEAVGVISDAELQNTLLRWNDSNHECLLFSNDSHVVHFLSLDTKVMRQKMHPGLLRHLQLNHINVGSDLNQASAPHAQILSSLTDVYRTKEDAAKLLSGTYCLTGDSLMKMLAIFVRVRCGIPVVCF